MTECKSTSLTASSQSQLDKIIYDCPHGIAHTLSITDYVDPIVNFSAAYTGKTPDYYAIDGGLHIYSCKEVTAIDLGDAHTNRGWMLSNNASANQASSMGLTIEDLPALQSIDTAGLGLLSNLTIRNTPMLLKWGSGTFQLRDGGTVHLEALGAVLSDRELPGDFTAFAGHLWAVEVLSNINLTRVFPLANVVTVTTDLVLAGTKSEHLELVTLERLTSVGGNFNVSYAQSLDLPALADVGGDFTVADGWFDSLEATALTRVGGNFTVEGCANLVGANTSITLVGGSFKVGGNKGLQSLDGVLGSKATVAGGYYVHGAFAEVPVQDLQHVGGPMRINTTAPLDCYKYSNMTESLVSNFSCVSASGQYSRGVTAPPSSPPAKSPSKVNVGAICGGVFGGFAVVTIALGFAFWFWRRRQRSKILASTTATRDVISSDGVDQEKQRLARPISEIGGMAKATLPEKSDIYAAQIREMDAKEPPRELDGQRVVHEMDATDFVELRELTVSETDLQRQTWTNVSAEMVRKSIVSPGFAETILR